MSETFEDWWPTVGQNIGKVAAKSAWDYQQARIDELDELYKSQFKATGGLLARKELVKIIDRQRGELTALREENAALKAENAKLREAAQAVVEDDKRGPAPQIQQHLIDALAALLHTGGQP